MNRNLNEAIFDIAKVEAIMFAFENTYLELDVAPAARARADMATDAFYALWDAIREAGVFPASLLFLPQNMYNILTSRYNVV